MDCVHHNCSPPNPTDFAVVEAVYDLDMVLHNEKSGACRSIACASNKVGYVVSAFLRITIESSSTA